MSPNLELAMYYFFSVGALYFLIGAMVQAQTFVRNVTVWSREDKALEGEKP